MPAGSGKSGDGHEGRNGAPAHSASPFDPRTLDKAIIALPLLREMERVERVERIENAEGDGKDPRVIDVIIDVDLGYAGGRDCARDTLMALVTKVIAGDVGRLSEDKNAFSQQ